MTMLADFFGTIRELMAFWPTVTLMRPWLEFASYIT
jgi:hypothetical protein